MVAKVELEQVEDKELEQGKDKVVQLELVQWQLRSLKSHLLVLSMKSNIIATILLKTKFNVYLENNHEK